MLERQQKVYDSLKFGIVFLFTAILLMGCGAKDTNLTRYVEAEDLIVRDTGMDVSVTKIHHINEWYDFGGFTKSPTTYAAHYTATAIYDGYTIEFWIDEDFTKAKPDNFVITSDGYITVINADL